MPRRAGRTCYTRTCYTCLVGSKGSRPAESLRVVTWNVNGLESRRLGERMEKLCLELLVGGDLAAALSGAPTRPVPDVLLLQEVVRIAHLGYFRGHLGAAGFTLWPEQPPEQEHYELVAVRQPWAIERAERRAFEHSPLGRGCSVVTLRRPGDDRPITAMTAHLESLRSGAEARASQARQIDAWLRQMDHPAFFGGDTNLRDAEWSALRPSVRAVDAFERAGAPQQARFTWYPEESPRGFRFDRLWLDPKSAWRVRELQLRRCGRASDHLGVEAALDVL